MKSPLLLAAATDRAALARWNSAAPPQIQALLRRKNSGARRLEKMDNISLKSSTCHRRCTKILPQSLPVRRQREHFRRREGGGEGLSELRWNRESTKEDEATKESHKMIVDSIQKGQSSPSGNEEKRNLNSSYRVS